MSKPKDDPLIGKTIVKVRPMTQKEATEEGFESPHMSRFEEWTAVLELSDGSAIYASQDEEGNGPGALFHRLGDDTFLITAS